MQVIPLPIARVSNQLQSTLLLGNLQGNQLDLLRMQTQLATQQRVNRPSDDPAAAMSIVYLRRAQDANTQYAANLDQAQGFLNAADGALSSVSDALTQAKSIASSQIGITSTPEERQAQAQVVDSLLSRVLGLANTRYRNAAVFGGVNGTQDPFTATAGGYLYQGSTQSQGILTPSGESIDYTVDGNTIFGGLSAQVVGYRTLTPDLTASTPLADLNGGRGVTPGSIQLSSGATTVTVDLSKAATVGDVVTAIQQALTANGIGATVGLSGSSFSFTTNASTTLTVTSTPGSRTGMDLGLYHQIPPGTTNATAPTAPMITTSTPLSALNLDLSGLTISNGASSDQITFVGLSTVEDMLNAINGDGLHVRAEINASGNGFNLYNALSGTQLRIGEYGGTTADQLGLRSLNTGTLVADLNGGTGITPISTTGSGLTEDVRIARRDGTSFSVDFTGVKTIQDVLDKINTAAGNATPGSQVVASLNVFGNGIQLTDQTAGGGVLTVTPLNGSPVAGQLGINKTADASSPGQIAGDDVNGVAPKGIFSSLMALRDALNANDCAAITRAAQALEADAQRVVQARGTIGARVKDLAARRDQSDADGLQFKSSISALADVDMTEAITRFQTLQTAYEASLKAAATSQNQSLMDFLR